MRPWSLSRSFAAKKRISLSLFFVLLLLPSPGFSQTISCGQTITDSISTVGEKDEYTFTATAGDKVTLRLVVTSGGMNPYLELYDPANTKIASNYSYSGNYTYIDKALTSGGTYRIVVYDHYNDETGTYNLTWQRLNAPCSATALSCGQPATGSLSAAGEQDFYTFTASAGDKVTLRTVVTSGGMNPYLELYDSTGARIAYNYTSSGNSTAIDATLTTGGTYTVVASDYNNDETGDYRLFFQRVNNPCGATALSMGQILFGSITPIGEIDTYLLQGVSQGATITLCTGSGDIQPYLELHDGAGTRIATGSSITNKQLTTAGPYTVLLQDSGANNTGSYKLSLQSGTFSCSSLDLQDPKVTVTAPSGGEIIETGSTFAIAWTSTDNVGVTSHEIRLSTDGGVNFPTVVATGLAGNVKSFNWSVPPGLATTKGRIRVIARDAAGNSGQADSNNFLVIDTAQLKITAYTYDQLNQLTRVEYEDGKVMTYSYDAAGNRTRLVVTAVSQALRLYIQGADNGLWVNTKTGSTWSGWSAVPGGGKSSSGPAVVLDGSSVRLVVRGLDNGIWTALAENPQWTALGGRTNHSPTAVMEGSTLHVFVRGTDGGLYLNSRSGGSFSGWSAVPGGGKSSSQPAAIVPP
jgi:YD repeat-containing protein